MIFGRAYDRKNRLKFDDPRVIDAFKAHCANGWSPRSFMGQLLNGHASYYKLLKTNEEFRKIAEQHTQPRKFYGNKRYS